MPANTATLDALLKDDYGPAIRTQLTDETPALDLFERDETPWEGRERVEAIHVNRNRGAYATAEGGQPPTAGNQQIENLRIPRRHVHGGMRITTQLIKASRSDRGAFARGMRLEMDRLMDDLRVVRNFYVWGPGTGVRAFINGDPGTGTTYTLDSPGGVAGATHGNRFLNIGDHVSCINPNTGALRAGGTREITAVAADGTTVTIGAAADDAIGDNDYVVKAYGSDASIAIGNTEWQHPPMGLLGLDDNGTYLNGYFNLSRTTFPILQSTVISSVGALSADVIQRAIDVAMQVGNAKISDFLMHPSVLRAYLTLMENDRRYTESRLMRPDAGTVAAQGKYKSGIEFGGVPITTDPFAPYGMWFGIDKRSFVRFVITDGEWADEDGAVLSRVSGAVDTYDAVYRIYDNFCCLRPNQSFRLDGITTSIVVAHIV